MCGIYGYLTLSQQHPVTAYAEASVDALFHRGPDESGVWQGPGIFLGMRRLSIIDLAEGQQPIWNEDERCCIIYNGELYNYLDLYPQLVAAGHHFRTHSDTEVILHAYEEWGIDCLRHLNGMYAFAIWDSRQNRLLLARDRIGIKPLYYYQDAERLIFASEIKAILADPTVQRQLNPQGLANFLAFGHAVAPVTMYQGIQKLLPGHYMVAKEDVVTIQEYWDVGDEPQPQPVEGMTEEAYAVQIVTLLSDAVRRQMIADVPVGAFLSGGVDSSSVVALMVSQSQRR